MTQAAAKPGSSREASSDKSIEAQVSTSESRKVLVSLYVQGSTNDAKALYGASQGANDAGWQALERMLTPVKQFIETGGMPYVVPGTTTEYAGIPVPEPEAVEDNPDPPETRSRGEYSAGRQPGNLSADVEAETKARTGTSLDANPGAGKSEDEDDDEVPPEAYSAKELVAQADTAKNAQELDKVERLAGGRTSVLDAVAERRKKLGIK